MPVRKATTSIVSVVLLSVRIGVDGEEEVERGRIKEKKVVISAYHAVVITMRFWRPGCCRPRV
jgi:hypothetical protein